MIKIKECEEARYLAKIFNELLKLKSYKNNTNKQNIISRYY